MHYQPKEIESKWQAIWEKRQAFRASDDPAVRKKKPKYYILDMFPYPSGAGLHVGHPEGYTATDVVARMKRAQGFNVLHPMGWDAFGLPAERAAVRENLHPAHITKRNIDNFRRQIKRLGFSYDWEREISTSDPQYYRWTQWIFLRLYEKGLAYMAEIPVNWCPALGTVLANEEVKEGKYVETGDAVERRLMKQWMLRITAYAERLSEDLHSVDWPDGVKQMQWEWIGKSTGAEILFQVEGGSLSFEVFTTRPDTLFGATYCVLAPEHPLVPAITPAVRNDEVQSFVSEMKQVPDLQRTDLAKEKKGVFTGAYALHPVTKKKIPIWIANYVLMTYGTGSIMAVPAHDERDHEFAKQYQLPIVQVIDGAEKPIDEAAHMGGGSAIHSDFLNGLSSADATTKMIDWLLQQKKGQAKVTYRLRDWLFSRQRYWGEPFPMAHLSDGKIVSLPDDALPITLPTIDEYRPTADGQPPLARADAAWREVKLKSGEKAMREVNTMPQWAGSCWYYLRFVDPKNKNAPWSKDAEKYWMPVDLYIGGVEHAVLHLLYARFWHKVFFDLGLVHTKEPFQKLFNQGMILCQSYRDTRGKYYAESDVEEKNGKYALKSSGEAVHAQIEKMSKSRMNVVSPDEVMDRYGADGMRLYELFMGPLEAVKPWRMDGVEGVSRFLARVWRLIIDERSGNLSNKLVNEPGASHEKLWRVLHKTIRNVTEDTEGLRFNTAISHMMTFTNEATVAEKLPREIVTTFLRLLSPYAPHLCEELWERLGEKDLIAFASWPVFDPRLSVDDLITIVIQVNGKVRERIEVERGLSKEKLEALARETPKVKAALAASAVKKAIVVPDRLVNFVI